MQAMHRQAILSFLILQKKGCCSAAVPKRSVLELCAFYDPWFIPTWPLVFGIGHQTATV